MFGVLEVIFRHDPVPGHSFGARKGQIAFIVSLVVLSVPRLGTRVSRRFISLGGLGCSRHGVGHNLRIWASLRRRGFKFRIMFHMGPCASGRCRTTFIRGICRVGRRGEGSDQALMGAGSWARHWIKNHQRWPNGSAIDRPESYGRAKSRFQAAVQPFPGGY